ncbi:MAG: HAD-IA family hydrolase [Patescibacteria group bacterium]|nr:HAD-IA family hydrolase [Patescibacteria group bacterium]
MKIKAVILAAGEGSRLYPFSTRENPKILMRFCGKPLLLHHIAEFLEHKIEDLVIVCNPQNRDLVQGIVAGAYPRLKVAFVVQKELSGPSRAIYEARKELQGADFFVLKYADSFSPVSPLPLLLKCLKENPKDGAILLFQVKDFKRFGIARFVSGKLVEIVEKPHKNPPSNLAWRGMSILSCDKFLQGFEKEVIRRGASEVAPPEYVLRVKGELNYQIINGEIFDLGYPWDILTFNRLLLDKFGGHVLSKKIGKNVRISSKSYIGPKAILGDGVKIGEYVSLEEAYVARDTEIRDSYVMPRARIGEACQIQKSVIGGEVNVGSHFKTKIKSKGKVKVFAKGDYKETSFSTLGCFLGPRVKVQNEISSEAGRIVYPDREVNKNIVQDILPIRAIFFDADNTLYQSRDAAQAADLAAMAYLAGGAKYESKELYNIWRNKIVVSLKESKSPVMRHRQYSYQRLIDKLKLRHRARRAFLIFREGLVKKLRIAPHLKTVLERLKDYKKIVVSEDNQDLIQFKLKKLDLEGYFDLVIAAETIGAMKPDKRYFDYALKRLKLWPGECVMIGDDWEKDLEIACKLGLRTIKWGDEDKRAHRNMKDFRTLLEILRII